MIIVSETFINCPLNKSVSVCAIKQYKIYTNQSTFIRMYVKSTSYINTEITILRLSYTFEALINIHMACHHHLHHCSH